MVAREHLAGPAHERLEQGELLGRQLDFGGSAPNLPGCRVQPKITYLQDGWSLRFSAAHDRAQARQQLGERERLRQIVVGAHVEPGDAILDRVARRQHQHRRPATLLPQLCQRLEPVDARQHHVEHDRVVGRRGGHPDRVFACSRDVGGVTVRAKAPQQQGRHLQLVFDDEDSHST